jgi:hypothetical protein
MRKRFYAWPFALLIAAACTVENPVADESVRPELSGATAPDPVYAGQPSGILVSVAAADPQGAADLERVECIEFQEAAAAGRDTLLDDGLEGDILPADGVFSGRIHPASAAVLRLAFLAVDREGHQSDTLWVERNAIAGSAPSAPVVDSTVVPDTLFQEQLGSVLLQCRVSDADGGTDVDSMFVDVFPPYAPMPSGRIGLERFQGPVEASPFVAWGTASADLRAFALIPGRYTFRFQARDSRGLESLPRLDQAWILSSNQAPVLSDPSVPDTVSRGRTGLYTLTIRVRDAQGAGDIRRVYFNTTKPDGSASGGNPFAMNDSGENGDAIEDDGVYSLTITISPQNALGTYRFEFFAEDLSGAVSEGVSRTITVVE